MIFKRLTLFLFTFLIFWSCDSETKISKNEPNKKYNIVWLVAEDQSPDFFPMYGDSTIQLPTIEALARESIIYDNAFANVPVCAPARSTIILGQYTVKTGTHNMRTFNAYNPDNEKSINVPSYTPIMGEGVKAFTKYLRAEDYYCTNNAKEDYNLKHTDGTWDESSQKAHWENRKEGQAFFAVFNFNKCHESGIWRFTDDSLFVDPSSIKVPPYFPDNKTVRHDMAVNYSNLKRIDDEMGEIVQQLKMDGLYDDTFIFFYGDHGGPFPRHKRSLYDSGIKVPLIVKLPKDLQTNSPSKRTDEIVSFIDLAPTVLSIAGLDKPDYMDGKAFLGNILGGKDEYVYATSDRFDAVYDRKRTIRSKKFKYIKNYHPEIPYALPVAYREQMKMMQNLRALDDKNLLEGGPSLWMRNVKDAEEFYDIVNDPYELNNLIKDEKFASEISTLRSALEDWQVKMNDLGGIPEQELIEKWTKMKSSMSLRMPELLQQGDNYTVFHKNKLGNMVYKLGDSEVWHVYNGEVLDSGDMLFKVVHIGLEDSEELIVQL